jgi:tetratricopeptide (TPR) repeat protein
VRRLRLGLGLVPLVLASCGGPPPRAPLPPGEDYVYPTPGPGELGPSEVRGSEDAWKEILGGEGAKGEQDYVRLLSRRPGAVSLRTGRAYAYLRQGRFADAQRSFERVLETSPDYVPALVGGASAAARASDPEGALDLYRRALAQAPDDVKIQRRLGELKVRVTENSVAEGRALEEKGDRDGAIEALGRAIKAAPELAEVRLDLARLLAAKGDQEAAIVVLAGDPARTREVLLKLAELLTAQHKLDRSLEIYHELMTRDAKDAEALNRSLEIRKTLEFEGMPEEYRKIYDSQRLSRGELAALLSIKVRSLQRLKESEPPVAVDISGSWAREHIIKMLSLNIMDVYPNHTFQPGAVVRRGDLAQALGRILDLAQVPAGRGPQASDVSSNNVHFEAVSRTLAAGLMTLTAGGAFEEWRPVSGREAADAIEALIRVVGP